MQSSGLYWQLAQRLRRQQRSARKGLGFLSFITTASTVGIALGCIVFIAGLSVMNGFEEVLEKRFLSLIPQVEFTAVDGQLNDPAGLVAQAQAFPGVRMARRVIRTQAMLQKGTEFLGVQVNGIDLEVEQAISGYTSSTALQALAEPNRVLLGANLAARLGVSKGETVTFLVAIANSFRQPRRVVLEVAGIFGFGGQVDLQQAYVSLPTARKLVGLEQGVSAVELVLDDVFSAKQITNDLGRQLQEYLYLDSWMRTQGHLYRDIQLVRLVMYLVLMLVLAVACFNIVSTLVMTVQEKHRQIGILRTIGLKQGGIIRVFVWQGIQNALRGVSIGVVLGVLFTLNLPTIFTAIQSMSGTSLLNGEVYFIETIPVLLDYQDVVFVALCALVMGALATIYPAWKAAKLDIVKAIES
ncbi:lipoprotein-releasing ABC transporter permease subunit [Pseudidiomarina taiwanensis]|uniref:Lipoprotein-releasing system transmembrane subunit, LolC/LolE family n=1 Tax=Pseudidiomarina taiwanensis TaxID=337250 RepID=A0A432ZMN9_9GAMM|nr:lipoprotein-releasing ABC transporter permease subunit [Pseudidiomarina taiwanensis]RUO79144.1 lipoprotein-releasing system transmembrane subunit, LolC/LolE family [Pseudidiomarina taiwanensis]